MSTLTQTEIKNLKQKAHHLKPVIITGAKGLTDAVHAEIDVAITHHELIKIKVNAEDRDERDAMIDEICKQHDATLISRVGNMACVYKKREED